MAGPSFSGGNAGTRPRFGDLVARDLTAEKVVDCAQRLLQYYGSNAKPHERTARFMERIGIDLLKSELLSLIPYIPLEKVNQA
jgi:NAD(P)H-nitrite reductase large subunit